MANLIAVTDEVYCLLIQRLILHCLHPFRAATHPKEMYRTIVTDLADGASDRKEQVSSLTRLNRATGTHKPRTCWNAELPKYSGSRFSKAALHMP
jgi:hypothetical protein